MDFFLRYKKIFFVIAFLGLAFIFGYFLYKIFFGANIVNPKPTSEEEASSTPVLVQSKDGSGNQQIISSTTPLSGENNSNQTGMPGKINPTTNTRSIEGAVYSPSLGLTSSNGAMQYYDKDNGQFYRLNANGESELMTDKVFYNVETVSWAPSKNQAILEYPDGSNIYYDFQTKKQATLPAHWEDFTFSPNGDKVVSKSIGDDVNNRWLITSNPDGSEAKAIESIGKNADKIITSWSPNLQVIAMMPEGIDFNNQDLYLIGQNHENFKSLTISGRGFKPLWNPNGDKLLYSVYSSDNGMRPTLWIANANGDSAGTGREKLNINTWADKCVFADTNNLICSVPKELPEGYGFMEEAGQTTEEDMYQINLATGVKKIIPADRTITGAYNLSVSSDGKYLYFTESPDNKIYKINLK